MAPSDDLKWGISRFKASERRSMYARATNYYDGNQPMAFATAQFRSKFFTIFKDFADNLCPAVVDSLTDRLVIEGWRSTEAQLNIETVASEQPGIPGRKKVTIDDSVGTAALELWNDNKMESRSAEIHREALRCGDAYCLVWPNEEMKAEFWPQTALEMDVEYDPNYLGRISRAVKIWYLPLEKKWRLNIYTLDEIQKYITTQENPNGIPEENRSWQSMDAEWVPNPYGRVPVFHFPNKRCYKPGISELLNIFPIQDALNKSIIDMLVAMEFAAYKQRYIIGLDVEVDENTGEPTDENVREYGVDRIMAFANEDTKVGQFDATDLKQFLEVSEKFRMQTARVSGTPLHYFFITSGDFPSGEAMKSAEARFVTRIEHRQKDWGPEWSEAIKFGLMMEQSVADDTVINPLWGDASPRTDSELADTATKKKTLGVSRSQLLHELGYDDETIDRMLEETDAYAAAQAALQASARGPDIPPTTQNGGGQGAEGTRRATTEPAPGARPGVRQ